MRPTTILSDNMNKRFRMLQMQGENSDQSDKLTSQGRLLLAYGHSTFLAAGLCESESFRVTSKSFNVNWKIE